MLPRWLKTWFVIHFLADIAFALPLLIAPAWFLGFFGWQAVDPFTTRLVAAALFGIGGVSFISRNAGIDSYRTMLNLKIIWCVSAILGMILSILQGAPASGWLFVGIFTVFSAVWIYYRQRLEAG